MTSSDNITRTIAESFHKFNSHEPLSGSSTNGISDSDDRTYLACKQTLVACLVGVVIGWIGLYRISRANVTDNGRISYSITFATFSLSMLFSVFMFCTEYSALQNILAVSFIFCTEISLIFDGLVDLGVLRERSKQFVCLSAGSYVIIVAVWILLELTDPSAIIFYKDYMFFGVAVASFATFGILELILIVRQRGAGTAIKVLSLLSAGSCAFFGLFISERLDGLGLAAIDVAMLDLLFFFVFKVRYDSEASKATTLPLVHPSKVPPLVN
eukprot:TRINITY_DN9042_c0_g1_i1.p1 TRINITY_DN9042_c0_g1~~TRINITY_DN9042_c0_g1_i1.p1  ORF type:complete len:270 (+),score=27.45 TRINITY_DN9042_c0_g1_i1:160-969(+)